MARAPSNPYQDIYRHVQRLSRDVPLVIIDAKRVAIRSKSA
jgi:hypothetical protein